MVSLLSVTANFGDSYRDHISKEESTDTQRTQGFSHCQAALCNSTEILIQVFLMISSRLCNVRLYFIIFKVIKKYIMLSQG